MAAAPASSLLDVVAQIRPKPPHDASSPPPITFQLLDIYEGVAQSYFRGKDALYFAKQALTVEDLTSDGFYHEVAAGGNLPKPAYAAEYQCLVLFGCDLRGYSVCCQVRYYPYIYVRVADHWGPTQCEKLISEVAGGNSGNNNNTRIFYELERKHNLAGWESDPQDPMKRRTNTYVKLRFSCLRDLKKASMVLTKLNYEILEDPYLVPSYLKFLDEQDLVPGGWVTVEEYSTTPVLGYCSLCQIEIQAKVFRAVKAPKPVMEQMAPVLIMSVDGEMRSAKRKFPDEANRDDNIIGIGVSLQRYNSTKYDPTAVTSVYFALKSPGVGTAPTAEIPFAASNASRRSHYIQVYETEAALLEGYRDFLVLVDPDIVIGYNTHRFDWRYFFRRAQLLGLDSGRFFYQSRLAGRVSALKECKMESAAFGQNADYEIEGFVGRCDLDMLINIKRNPNFKLRSYKLSAVSLHFLKDDKVDLDAQAMFKAFDEEGAAGCEKIATYCVQDTLLPLQLMYHTLAIPNLIEMARLSSTLPQQLISRGQVLKITHSFFREAHLNGFVFNSFADTKVPEYVGATVIEPKLGFYDDYVVVLDFASLYPSICIDYNLSNDTLILAEASGSTGTNPHKTNVLPPHRVIPGASNDRFVTHAEGLLPRMEKKFLQSRRDVKKRMKLDPQNAMLDAKQLCIKLVCNSIYGYTSTATNRMNCPSVGRTITHYGREMIQTTKRLIEERYGAQVIYGDTDSVFIRFVGVPDLAEAFRLGHEAAAMVTKHFGGEYIELTMEKVFRPFLLLAKKRYSGVKYESPEDPGKLANRGLDNVRRDVPLFVTETYDAVLDALVKKKDVLLAQKVLFQRLCDLEDGAIPAEKFEISVQLKSDYASDNLPQVAVMKKMRSRNPGSEPSPGERFNYTLVDVGRDNVKVYEKAEDPVYAAKHNLPLDYCLFIERLETSVSKLFAPFTDHPEVMFARVKDIMRSRQRRNKSVMGDGDPVSEASARTMPVLPPKKTKVLVKRLCEESSSNRPPPPSQTSTPTPLKKTRTAAAPPPPSINLLARRKNLVQ